MLRPAGCCSTRLLRGRRSGGIGEDAQQASADQAHQHARQARHEAVKLTQRAERGQSAGQVRSASFTVWRGSPGQTASKDADNCMAMIYQCEIRHALSAWHSLDIACRAAASPLIKSAEKACNQECKVEKQQNRSKAAAAEAHYLDLYNSYQSLVTQFRNGSMSPGKSRFLQQQLVETISELSAKAKQLISLKAQC
jgi:hypothetical protein